jgi:hypothetical protein
MGSIALLLISTLQMSAQSADHLLGDEPLAMRASTYAPAVNQAADRTLDYASSIKKLLNAKKVHHLTFEVIQFPATHDHALKYLERESSLASAIARAAKKSVIERGVEASTDAVLQCQRESSPALTTPFMRSDSQQAHCFRY